MATELLERPTINHPGKVINSYDKQNIISDLVRETSQTEISQRYNVSQSRISQIKSENQVVIDQRKQELIKLLPDIVEVSKEDILMSKDINKTLRVDINSYDEDIQRSVTNKLKFKALANKLGQDILKISGIFPSQALLNFNQYNQDNRQINIEPSIQGLFSGKFSDNMEVIEMKEVSNSDSERDNVDNSQ